MSKTIYPGQNGGYASQQPAPDTSFMRYLESRVLLLRSSIAINEAYIAQLPAGALREYIVEIRRGELAELRKAEQLLGRRD
jgi:hypothetical protein